MVVREQTIVVHQLQLRRSASVLGKIWLLTGVRRHLAMARVAAGTRVEMETMSSKRKGLEAVGNGERIHRQALAFQFIEPAQHPNRCAELNRLEIRKITL